MAISSLADARDITESVDVDFSQQYMTGGYSDVFRGTMASESSTNILPVAVKIPRYQTANVVTMTKMLSDIRKEVSLWGKLAHPNVIPLLGLYRRDIVGQIVLPGAVSPWCDGGTIIDYVRSAREGRLSRVPGPVHPDDFNLFYLEVELLSQAANGLAYLHKQNIAHGDIKGGNILVHNGTARLSDFGFSVVLAERTGGTSSHLGTRRWFAPDSLRRNAHRTRQADMWAMGCVILEVRTLHPPYHEHADVAVLTALRNGDLPYEYPCNMNTALWQIATECWTWVSESRLQSYELSAHLEDLLASARTLHEELSSLRNTPQSDITISIPQSIASSVLASLVAQIEQNQDIFSEPAQGQKVLNALLNLGERYPFPVVRRLARHVAVRDVGLAERIMTQLSTPELRPPLRGHWSSISAVAFLPDNRCLVSGSDDQTIRIWDIGTGKTVIGPLRGHTGDVSCVAVHGARIASCSYDGTYRVWDANSGARVLGPIKAHGGQHVLWIAFSRDGSKIATGGRDNLVILWDATTGVRLRDMIGHSEPVTCVAFSEDGKRLVSSSWDTTIRIWHVASGEGIGEPVVGPAKWVYFVSFGLGDKRLFSSYGDQTIRIWDVETRRLAVDPMQADDMVYSTALSPDRKRLVSGSSSGGIAMWDVETGASIPIPFRAHSEQVWRVDFSPDGRKIVSASADGTIALWDATDNWKRYDIEDENAVEKDGE